MNALTVAQMREADRRCIEDLGIAGAVLMNNAGAAVFREIPCGPVGIVCGKGNNGGDGFVVARLALLKAMEVHLVILANPDDLRGDAAAFFEAYHRLGGLHTAVTESQSIAQAFSVFSSCCTMIDAMLGTGTTGEVRGVYREAIQHWPAIYTIAIDIPSGLNADTGEVCGAALRADTTVTLHAPKAGFTNPAAAPFLGKVVVADIGIPPVCGDDAAWQALKAQWKD